MRPGSLSTLRVAGCAVAALAAAGASAAAFPPWEQHQAAWFGLVPLLLMAMWVPPRTAFRWGAASGTVFWLCTLSWLLRLDVTAQLPLPVAVAAWGALSAYCGLYTGAFAALAADWFRRAGTGHIGRNLLAVGVLPAAWVGLEYLRSTLFTGFSWNALGVSQVPNLAVAQVAEWGGVYAISGLIVMVNASVALTLARLVRHGRDRKYRPHPELFVGLASLAACIMWGRGRYEQFASPPGDLAIAAIQPAVPQDVKWSEEFVAGIYDRLATLTEEACMVARAYGLSGPDLTVWPETAVPDYVLRDGTARAFADALASSVGPILVGAMDFDGEARGARFFNSSILFEGQGISSQRYDKQHLVPFGEYIPLDKTIPLLARASPLGWSCTAGTNATVFRVPGRPECPFGVLICFEDAIAPLARRAVKAGARLLINQTNDAWFDNTPEQRQHMLHGVLRCIENRVPAVRCANSGLTSMIDRNGHAYHGAMGGLDAGNSQPGALSALVPGYDISMVSVPAASMTMTAYTRYGDSLLAIPCAVGTGCWILALVAMRRRDAGTAEQSEEEAHGRS